MKRSFIPVAVGLALLAWPPGAHSAAAGAAATVSESGPLVLTLEQTLGIASEQNSDVRKAREYRAQVEARYGEEKSAALPRFTVSGSAAYSGDDSQKGLGPPARTDNYALTLGVVQPLFTWGQIGAAIRLADIGRATAADRMAGARGTALRDAAIAFCDVLLAREFAVLATQNLEQRGRHLEEARRKLSAGTATEFDVLAASVAEQNARPDVIRAANAVSAARERLAFVLGVRGREVDVAGTLAATAGATVTIPTPAAAVMPVATAASSASAPPAAAPVASASSAAAVTSAAPVSSPSPAPSAMTVAPAASVAAGSAAAPVLPGSASGAITAAVLDPAAALPDYATAFQAAALRRPELAELRKGRAMAGEMVRIAQAGNKPRLDLGADLGWRALNMDGKTGDGGTWSAGLRMTWPIFDGGRTKGAVGRTRSEERSLGLDEARFLDALALETRTGVDAVREAAAIVEALDGTVAQAERLLTMAEKGFELGVKVRLDVDDAQLNLLQARAGLARGRRDLLAARVNLAWVTGELAPAGH